MELKWKSFFALTKQELYELLNLRQQVFVVEGCVNVLLPHPHRVRIMPIEYDTRVGARLA